MRTCKMDKQCLYLQLAGKRYNSHKRYLCCAYPSQLLYTPLYALHIKLIAGAIVITDPLVTMCETARQ